MAITTKFYTWTETWAKIKTELDIDDDDDFIDETEAMGMANDVIDEAENEIVTLYEDYFLVRDTITLVSGTDNYSLPSSIFAHKIRGVVYFNGTDVYEVKRVRDWKKFLFYRHSRVNTTNTEDYAYFITNSTAGTPKILLCPPAYEDGALIEIWFIRQANRITTGADPIDLPEFHTFVFAGLTERIEGKRAAGSPRHQVALDAKMRVKQEMIDTLTAMVPDGQNEIEADTSAYDDMN